ncbi:MAG: hypothetical protein A2Y62_10675 [Candidatus Fischerbacteria bacterium RBG_13_37_8]|uniref:Uncharacterized protein n=1 Tax=Candidatus Fischerbacteria bacterium RBG_13_37_8 TaxID=1817863 RepID=A0A1F5VTM9_9BACT|nr:MAG: hypothetical protein A2Y62_10675 [Candidatus Fischerbacteria bacterium RBG_13_37_8]
MKFSGILVSLVLALSILSFPALTDEIHDAAKAGNLEKVKELIAENAALVNAKTERGITPLHNACASENAELVEFLLSKGADVNAQNDSLYTPLHFAAGSNRPEAVKLLLQNGAKIDAQSREGETPLHTAAFDGLLDVAKILVEKSADVHIRNAYGRTPFLLVARESGHVEMAKYLLEKGSDINALDKFGDGALELSSWRGFNDFVGMLLDKGAKIPENSRARVSLLNHSVERSLEKLFQALIKAGLDLKEVKKQYPQLILSAAAGGSTKIFDLLVKEGFDMNYVDAYGWTPLHNAAEFGRHEVIEYLLEKGAAIDARTKMGETAFNIAQVEKDNETADFLKKKSANTEAPKFPVLKGNYLGQKKPGKTPVPFAPGIATAHYGLHSIIAFSPDGKTAFWNIMMSQRKAGYGSSRMLGTSEINGKWSYPTAQIVERGDVPMFSHDGKRLYFISRKPIKDGSEEKENIWFAERTKTGWSEPQPFDPVVNSTSMHWQFSFDKKGTFYIGSGDGRIMVSQKKDGKYQNPVDFRELYKNDSVSGISPFISPDGNYLIFSKDDDLHIIFRKPDGTWTQAQNLGEDINSSAFELCPMVTHDGEYLFFLSTRDGESSPFWVAIKDKIMELRNQAL